MKKYLIIFTLLIIIPNFAWAASPILNSASTNWISVVNRLNENNSTIALYGSGFSDVIFNDVINIYLGDLKAENISGNDSEINVTFNFTKNQVTDQNYDLIIKNDSTKHIYSTLDNAIRIFDPYNKKYQKPHLKKFFKNSKKRKASKRRVGLNVHQTMASEASTDDEYLDKLENSDTKWAREHFSHNLIMGDDKNAWVTRYDKIMEQYDKENIRVVGMLAYDQEQDYSNISIGAWKKYVRYTVRRYRNYVDVWEIWNEPDSPTYLKPSTMEEYKPILKSGYKITKHYDPNSKVLNGGVANIGDTKFIDSLYRRGHKYFDALNIHLYYCDEYQSNNNNNAQRVAIENLERTIFKGKRNKKVWVTEIGCSTYTNELNQNTQKNYIKNSVNYLLNLGYVQNILIYTTRDRNISDNYEANFGLIDLDFKNKKAWKWYRRLNKK